MLFFSEIRITSDLLWILYKFTEEICTMLVKMAVEIC